MEGALNMARIGFIGLGNMGGGMAANLAKAGHDVRAFDLSEPALAKAEQAGCTREASAADAVREADAVVTMLPAGKHVRDVYLNQVFGAAPADAIMLDCSTIDVATAREVEAAAQAKGIVMVDAPVSGGIAGAIAGTLTFMLGGDDDAVARATGLVQPMAGHVFAVGGPTMGIAAKLANNLMLFVSLLGVAEGSQLAAKLGLDPETFFKVASVSSGDSWPLRTWYPVPGVVSTSPANRNFDATFTTQLADKDLSFALAAGDDAGLNLPAARLALDQFERLIDEGYGGKDCSLIVKYASADGHIAGFDPDA